MNYNHGSLSSYTHGRCRCDDCKAAARTYRQANKSRKNEWTRAYRAAGKDQALKRQIERRKQSLKAWAAERRSYFP